MLIRGKNYGIYLAWSINEKYYQLLKSRIFRDKEENELPDDDLINEMIARSEDELEIFKQIDIDRRKKETQSRLIEEAELPDWLVKNDDEVVCNKVSGVGITNENTCHITMNSKKYLYKPYYSIIYISVNLHPSSIYHHCIKWAQRQTITLKYIIYICLLIHCITH